MTTQVLLHCQNFQKKSEMQKFSKNLVLMFVVHLYPLKYSADHIKFVCGLDLACEPSACNLSPESSALSGTINLISDIHSVPFL